MKRPGADWLGSGGRVEKPNSNRTWHLGSWLSLVRGQSGPDRVGGGAVSVRLTSCAAIVVETMMSHSSAHQHSS